jgi:hypothetical protein
LDKNAHTHTQLREKERDVMIMMCIIIIPSQQSIQSYIIYEHFYVFWWFRPKKYVRNKIRLWTDMPYVCIIHTTSLSKQVCSSPIAIIIFSSAKTLRVR